MKTLELILIVIAGILALLDLFEVTAKVRLVAVAVVLLAIACGLFVAGVHVLTGTRCSADQSVTGTKTGR